MIRRLAWVTAREARGHDVDEPAALDALRAAGVDVDVVDWDDPSTRWSDYDRTVLRSAWDYPERLEEFMRWTERVAAQTVLLNPPEMVRWSSDKRYLGDLERQGIPITPTVFVPPGEEPRFPDGRFVVKPAVGAGSRDAASFRPDQTDQAQTHLGRLHEQGRTALIQPFLGSVEREGEWPMVFLDGRFSHAANKRIDLPEASWREGLFAVEINWAHTASPEQIEVARSVVDLVTERFGRPAYARVDLVRDDAGEPCVLEVELVEPSLFLAWSDDQAPDRLARALLRP